MDPRILRILARFFNQLADRARIITACPKISTTSHANIAYRKQIPPQWTVGAIRSE